MNMVVMMVMMMMMTTTTTLMLMMMMMARMTMTRNLLQEVETVDVIDTIMPTTLVWFSISLRRTDG